MQDFADIIRAIGKSKNLGVPVFFGRLNLPHLVEIGLTDLQKYGGAMAPPAPPGDDRPDYVVGDIRRLFIPSN